MTKEADLMRQIEKDVDSLEERLDRLMEELNARYPNGISKKDQKEKKNKPL